MEYKLAVDASLASQALYNRLHKAASFSKGRISSSHLAGSGK
jgi:hypothetical protein